MTPEQFNTTILRIAQFYPNFYKTIQMTAAEVAKNWYPLFRDDDAVEVDHAVTICFCTLKFPPTVADIKLQMAESRLEGQPTSIEAFQTISGAVDRSYTRDDAIEQYSKLSPILRKLVGKPAQLVTWHKISDEAFATVIMSAIRESYQTLAKREAKYYALPAGLQKTEAWRIEAPAAQALPEPEITKTISQVVEEANAKAAEHGMTMTDELREKHASRLDGFFAPMTEAEIKMIEKREAEKAERYLK